jgi:hypothetical protein
MCRGWVGSVGLEDVYRVDTAGGNPGRELGEEGLQNTRGFARVGRITCNCGLLASLPLSGPFVLDDPCPRVRSRDTGCIFITSTSTLLDLLAIYRGSYLKASTFSDSYFSRK